MILSIDPGNEKSAYCIVDEKTRKPLKFDKVDNDKLCEIIRTEQYDKVAIEMIASYGMAVGREVFDTCRWIGYFEALTNMRGIKPTLVYRKDEKMHLCQSMKAKDANIRRALIDRFAEHDLKTGRGTKRNPDWFYGFHDDIWAAYAVAITYLETNK